MTQTANIIVIGGGVIGLSCAWRLAKAGNEVIVLEKNKCGDGATISSLGALVPYDPWREEVEPNRQRNSLWQYGAFAGELFAETNIDIGYSPLTRIHLIQSQQHYDRLSSGAEIACENWPKLANAEAGKAMEIITPEQVLKLEPNLEPTHWGALCCRATAKVDPKRLMAALRSACMKNGVDIRENSPAIKLLTENNKIIGVKSATGTIKASKIILAAGAWSTDLLPENVELKLVRPIKGQALELEVKEPVVKRLIRGLGIYIMPITSNKIWLGATKERNSGFDESLTTEAYDHLLNKAESLCPALAEAKVIKQWCGFRPNSQTGGPIVGNIEGVEGLFSATGHGGNGLCSAPVTGIVVTNMLASE